MFGSFLARYAIVRAFIKCASHCRGMFSWGGSPAQSWTFFDIVLTFCCWTARSCIQPKGWKLAKLNLEYPLKIRKPRCLDIPLTLVRKSNYISLVLNQGWVSLMEFGLRLLPHCLSSSHDPLSLPWAYLTWIWLHGSISLHPSCWIQSPWFAKKATTWCLFAFIAQLLLIQFDYFKDKNNLTCPPLSIGTQKVCRMICFIQKKIKQSRPTLISDHGDEIGLSNQGYGDIQRS